MKRILNLTSIVCFLLLSSLAYAGPNTYYVTQNGNGAKSGQSLGNAWSVSDFNNSSNWSTIDNSNKIDPGDTVYFSGTITSQLLPKGSGSSGNVITLDGYQAGDCDPLNSVCSSSALLSGSSTGIWIKDGYDYLTVQDFRMTGGRSDMALFLINDPGTSGKSDHITVQRNYIYNANMNMFEATRTSAYNGSDWLTVYHNKMTGYGKSADPAQGVKFYYTTNLIVRGNIMAGGGSSNCSSDEVISVHTNQNSLFEYNDIYGAYRQTGIAIKEPSPYNRNVIVRFNKIHDNGDTSGESGNIIIQDQNSYIYIYGNYLYQSTGTDDLGLDLSQGAHHIYIWSNIIANSNRDGFTCWTKSGWPSSHDVYVYNNDFVHNATEDTGSTHYDWSGYSPHDSGSTNFYFKNNILYYNRPNASTYHQVYIPSGMVGEVDMEYNTYYYPGQTPTVYYNGDYRTISKMVSYGLENDSPTGGISNPGFTDPAGSDNIYGTKDDDYTLNGTNINNGKNLSQCFNVTVQGNGYTMCFEDALDPNATNWKTSPPTVRTAKQGSNGAWERGAYVYGTGTGSPDLNAPSGLKIIVGGN